MATKAVAASGAAFARTPEALQTVLNRITSMTKATYTTPCEVRTQVKSDTDRASGRLAWSSRASAQERRSNHLSRGLDVAQAVDAVVAPPVRDRQRVLVLLGDEARCIGCRIPWSSATGVPRARALLARGATTPRRRA